jgi:hypothetical protein
MVIGGEFYQDERWATGEPGVSTGQLTFLNGGKAALIVISESLLNQGIDQILLPSYLCPTIVDTLEQRGVKCAYYHVNIDLSPEPGDLANKARSQRAILFINYFGFHLPEPVKRQLMELQANGVILVEDNAQGGFWQDSTGDFVFNSMRKLVPHDGGYLFSRFDVTPIIQKHHGMQNRRLPVIREYRQKLADYLFKEKYSYPDLRDLYEMAERHYNMDTVIEGDGQERFSIEHLDWEGIKTKRRDNYLYLLNAIREVEELPPIFPFLEEENLPLGLPVYVKREIRDQLFDDLGNEGIGLTVHWKDVSTDARLNHNPTAVDISRRILTLVIDQRCSHKQLDHLVRTLKDCLCKYRMMI